MARISCTNCGGEHASAAEVRRCFTAGAAADPSAPSGSSAPPASGGSVGGSVGGEDDWLADLDRYVEADVDLDGDVEPSPSAGPDPGSEADGSTSSFRRQAVRRGPAANARTPQSGPAGARGRPSPPHRPARGAGHTGPRRLTAPPRSRQRPRIPEELS